MKSIFLCENAADILRVYSEETMKELEEIAELDLAIKNAAYVKSHPNAFGDVQYIFSTWGMPVFTEDEIKTFFPSLQCVFYAAGTVQYFARPFLKCGVRVFSAWAANAVPVAEYTVAQILLANKGFFAASRQMSSGDPDGANTEKPFYPGNYRERVGLIGAGMIGSLVIQMLKSYRLSISVFDPFLSDERAAELGVQKRKLKELFSECFVVSNHLANNAQTQGMLDYDCFCRMRSHAVFLNTGRGAQVVEDDLVRILTERSDLTAVLDVTYPEPPVAGHAFYRLPNCILTPHIAGSSGDEVHRMAEYMLREYKQCVAGESSRYEVTEEMLRTMA